MALPPECQLDRLADLVPPPRKHRHRYHGVFAPNHKLRRAVTALAIGNVGKRREVAVSPPLPHHGARADPCESRRQEPAHFEPEVRTRAKARMASPA
jgi:hypothetical protein